MDNHNVSVNIHQAARNLIAMPELPSLCTSMGMPNYGLCYALAAYGDCDSAYDDIRNYGAPLSPYADYLPERGHWTEQRLNILCLLAITEPGDWV